MPIPIENIYYLLSYAWNKLDEKEQIKVSIDDNTQLIDLFAKVLITATNKLLKRGIDKDYIEKSEEIYGVKGKIEISETLKSNLIYKQKTICNYDDFSSNILHNQILVTTINNLIKTNNLDNNLKSDLIKLKWRLSGIDQIEIKSRLFNKIKLNRNNRFYEFIINVCQIIHENTLPSEEKGRYKFSDFTRDEKKMNRLFEAFIRNFYKIEQRKFNIVKKEIIKWQFQYFDSINYSFLPQMETDITLENDNEKIIIDAKFYKETMSSYFNNEKIKSTNLYQLFSYLLNQQDGTKKTITAKGILLYPTIQKDYNLDFRYKEHPILIRTINLNTGWKNIHNRLVEIINEKPL
jgi:5-methylcytosine-specific restriction enzyme subunit McrC